MFYYIREQLPIPPKVSTSQNRRNMDLWCEYHREHNHTLSQCRELKKVLYRLADKEELDRYLKHDKDIKEKMVGKDFQGDQVEMMINNPRPLKE